MNEALMKSTKKKLHLVAHLYWNQGKLILSVGPQSEAQFSSCPGLEIENAVVLT